MEIEPTLGDALKHLAVNAVLAVSYLIILVSPLAAWVMTP
jgi:hypothetical protein